MSEAAHQGEGDSLSRQLAKLALDSRMDDPKRKLVAELSDRKERVEQELARQDAPYRQPGQRLC